MIRPFSGWCLAALPVLCRRARRRSSDRSPRPRRATSPPDSASSILNAPGAMAPAATGGTGPNLRRTTLRHAATDRDDSSTIVRNGIPGTEMPAFTSALTETMAWQTAAYVRSLGRARARPLPGNAAARRGAVRRERLRRVPRRQRTRRRARSGADHHRRAARRAVPARRARQTGSRASAGLPRRQARRTGEPAT